MQELSEDYKETIRNLQNEVNSLKEKVKQLSWEIFEIKTNKNEKLSILGYGSEYDD